MLRLAAIKFPVAAFLVVAPITGVGQTPLPILPLPRVAILGPSVWISKSLSFRCGERVFEPAIQAFREDFRNAARSRGQAVEIVRDRKLPEEGYGLELGRRLILRASTAAGLAHGLQTLGQLRGRRVAYRTIFDQPQVGFRCVMIDVARRFYSIATLKTLVRGCAVGKVRYLQLHLTDDQNWMFPTRVLAGVDKRNTSHHRAYTLAELATLQAFAAARGVTVIPEIDMPGHCALAVAVDPTKFGIRGSQGSNCLNFASPTVRSIGKRLIGEVAQAFPDSPYIHVGGDEAWYPNAELDPEFQRARSKLGPSTGPNEVFADFLGEMTDEVIRLHRTPMVWEGFAKSRFAARRISKKAIVVAWDGTSYPARQLIPDGYQVVNAGWDPNYVVNHYPYDVYSLAPLEELYRSQYRSFGTFDPGPSPSTVFQFPDSEKLKGSMLCWWEGQPWNALKILPDRILAFGARLWNPEKECNFRSFLARLPNAKREIDQAAYPFSLNVQGTRPENQGEFLNSATLSVHPREGHLVFGFRTDGESPSVEDVRTNNEIELKTSGVVSVQAFHGSDPVGETKFCKLVKVHQVPNLAFHCPVTTSASFDPQFPPQRVTSGVSDDLSAYWLAYPNPQTLTIDLGAVKEISRVEVVACWAGGSPARYRLWVSRNGRDFSEIVDASKATMPATPEGYVHRFSPLPARYVRIQTLRGDLYPPSMLRINQIRVFNDVP